MSMKTLDRVQHGEAADWPGRGPIKFKAAAGMWNAEAVYVALAANWKGGIVRGRWFTPCDLAAALWSQTLLRSGGWSVITRTYLGVNTHRTHIQYMPWFLHWYPSGRC